MQNLVLPSKPNSLTAASILWCSLLFTSGISLRSDADSIVLPQAEIDQAIRQQLNSAFELQNWTHSLTKETKQGPITMNQLSLTMKVKLLEPLYRNTDRLQEGRVVLEVAKKQGSLINLGGTAIVVDTGGLGKNQVQVMVNPAPRGKIGNPLSAYPDGSYVIGTAETMPVSPQPAPTSKNGPDITPDTSYDAADPLQKLINLSREQGEIWGREEYQYGGYKGSPVILHDIKRINAQTLEGTIDHPYQQLSNPFVLIGVAPNWTLKLKNATPAHKGINQTIYTASLEADTLVARRGPVIALSAAKSRALKDRFARELAPWEYAGEMSDYAQLGNALINLNTMEMVSEGWGNQPVAPVKNLPGRFWPVITNYQLSVQPFGAYRGSDVHTEDPKQVSLNPLREIDGQTWVSADLSRYVRLKEGDLWGGVLDWQNNSASPPKNLTNIGLLNDLKPLSWCGDHFFFYNVQATEKPILRIHTGNGEILELAKTKALNLHSQGSPDGRFLFTSDGGRMTHSAAGAESLVHVFDCLKNVSFSLDATLDQRIYIGTQKQPRKALNVTAQTWLGRSLFRTGPVWDIAWYDLENRKRVLPGQFPELTKALPFQIQLFNNRYSEIPGGRFLDIIYEGWMRPPDGQTPSLQKRYRVDRIQRTAVPLPAKTDTQNNNLAVTWVDENRYVYARRKGSLSEVGTWLYDVRSGQQTRLTPFFQDEQLYAENPTFTDAEQTIWSTPLYTTNLYLVLPDKNRIIFSATRGNVQELLSVSLDGGDLIRKPMPRSSKLQGQIRLRRVHPYAVNLPYTQRSQSQSRTGIAQGDSSGTASTANSADIRTTADATITDPVAREAAEIKAMCYSKPVLRSQFDCECVASKFSERRQAMGSATGQDQILGSITLDTSCSNIPGIRRAEYASCMQGRFKQSYGIEREAYCQCYAGKVSQSIAGYSGALGPTDKSSIRLTAMAVCRKPSSYE